MVVLATCVTLNVVVSIHTSVGRYCSVELMSTPVPFDIPVNIPETALAVRTCWCEVGVYPETDPATWKSPERAAVPDTINGAPISCERRPGAVCTEFPLTC